MWFCFLLMLMEIRFDFVLGLILNKWFSIFIDFNLKDFILLFKFLGDLRIYLENIGFDIFFLKMKMLI